MCGFQYLFHGILCAPWITSAFPGPKWHGQSQSCPWCPGTRRGQRCSSLGERQAALGGAGQGAVEGPWQVTPPSKAQDPSQPPPPRGYRGQQLPRVSQLLIRAVRGCRQPLRTGCPLPCIMGLCHSCTHEAGYVARWRAWATFPPPPPPVLGRWGVNSAAWKDSPGPFLGIRPGLSCSPTSLEESGPAWAAAVPHLSCGVGAGAWVSLVLSIFAVCS